MDELIPVTKTILGGIQQLTVDGREFHKVLQVKTKYTAWIADRLAEGLFTEGTDFVHTSEISETCTGAVRKTNHTLTLDTAKHISMMERTEIGRLARCYFIECERRYLASLPAPMSDDEMISKALVVAASKLKALEAKTAEQSGVIEAQAAKIEADAPKVTLAEAITSSGSYITVGQLANIVYQDGTETGRTRMFKHLRKYDWVIKDGSDHNRPTQKGMDSGFFRLDEEHRHINGIPQYDKAGRPIFDMVTKISPTGQAHFVNQFHEFRKRSLLDFLPRPRRSSNRLETI